jgi:hypothetical protein
MLRRVLLRMLLRQGLELLTNSLRAPKDSIDHRASQIGLA